MYLIIPNQFYFYIILLLKIKLLLTLLYNLFNMSSGANFRSKELNLPQGGKKITIGRAQTNDVVIQVL